LLAGSRGMQQQLTEARKKAERFKVRSMFMCSVLPS